MVNLDAKTVRPRGTDSVRVISVVEVTTTVGDGTPGNPSRTVIEYWSLSGERLAVSDDGPDTVCNLTAGDGANCCGTSSGIGAHGETKAI